MHATSRLGEDDEEDEQGPSNGAGAPTQAAATDPSAIKKQIMASIPKNWDGIVGFAVRWPQLDAAPPDVKARVAGTGMLRVCAGLHARTLCGARPLASHMTSPVLVDAPQAGSAKRCRSC